MKVLFAFLLLTLFLGCSKKDVIKIAKEIKKERCQALAVNGNKQSTDDFYVIKDFDNNRILKHIKTQLRDLNGDTHLYDFDITYANGKATFEGTVKVYHWELDNPPVQDPNSPPVYPEPDAPRHPVEQVELRDGRSFQVSFDQKTGYATDVRYVGETQPELTLAYNRNGRLTQVNEFVAKTDNLGNIVSILTPDDVPYFPGQHLGVEYGYNLGQSHKRQFYETPFIFIHHFYSLLEVLDWGPFQPASERTGFSIRYDYFPDDLPPYILDQVVYAEYSNHNYDENGNLISYDFDGNLSFPFPLVPDYLYRGHRTRSIEWACLNNIK